MLVAEISSFTHKQPKTSMAMKNAVFYLPYLEKSHVIIFIIGVFPFGQRGGLGADGLNTCPALSAAQPHHICPPALLCGICFKKIFFELYHTYHSRASLDTGWQRVIHSHLIKINKMCQPWPPAPPRDDSVQTCWVLSLIP